jgi:acetylxylan esterase
MYLTTALLATVVAVAAAPAKRQTIGAPCTDVHIFLAKGWNEPYPGRQGKLAGAICYDLPSCDYEDIQFYNPPEADYCASVTEGDVSGVAQMTAYADRCPDSKLILSGYSQGANVAGDILGGGGGNFGNETVFCTVGTNPGLDPETSPGNKRKPCLPTII